MIVIHADEGVGAAALPRQEGGVRRQRAFDLVAARARRFDGRDDDTLFLALAEKPVLAGVRIETAHDDLGRVTTNALESCRGEFDDVEDSFASQELRHLSVAHMDGDERAGDFLRILHHARSRGIGARRENFRVTGKLDAREAHRFFVQRRGGNGGDLPGERGVDGAIHISVTRAARGGVDGSGREVVE